MTFSKLLLQSLFDNIPDWSKKQDGNCYQSCIKYKTPPCNSQPKYLPQQFPPYYDDIDPNSIIKYRNWPMCIERFEQEKSYNASIIFALFMVLVVNFVIGYKVIK